MLHTEVILVLQFLKLYDTFTMTKYTIVRHLNQNNPRKASDMVLRSDELQRNLQHLNELMTTHEAAKQVDLSYWHFMHLVEAGRIAGVRVVDRWLFSPDDLADYKRSKYGELENMARTALEHPRVDLTEKQETICRYLLDNERPSAIARKLQQSRQAVHSQITLIKEKVSRTQTEPTNPSLQHTRSKQNSSTTV